MEIEWFPMVTAPETRYGEPILVGCTDNPSMGTVYVPSGVHLFEFIEENGLDEYDVWMPIPKV